MEVVKCQSTSFISNFMISIFFSAYFWLNVYVCPSNKYENKKIYHIMLFYDFALHMRSFRQKQKKKMLILSYNLLLWFLFLLLMLIGAFGWGFVWIRFDFILCICYVSVDHNIMQRKWDLPIVFDLLLLLESLIWRRLNVWSNNWMVINTFPIA